MYTTQNAFRNLIRNKKRYLLTGILLLAAFSVLICAVFHYSTFDNIFRTYDRELLSDQAIVFRQELLYRGGLGGYYTEGREKPVYLNGELVFDMEAMAAYNHPYPFTREMFDDVADAEEVESCTMTYMETGYRLTDTPEEYLALGVSREKAVAEHRILGGDWNTFLGFAAASNYDRVFRVELTAGEEPEDGECLITEYYARKYDLSVGDTLVLYDEALETVTAELTVSGTAGIFYTYWPYFKRNIAEEKTYSEFTGGYINYGTPFDRVGVYHIDACEQNSELLSLRGNLLETIFTTFDTAYYLYGDEVPDPDFAERHHFNKYLASYRLKEEADPAQFREKAMEILSESTPYAEEFTTAETFGEMYRKLTEPVSYHLEAAQTCILAGVFMGILILLTALIVNIRERRKDMGILWSLGVPERQTALLFGAESAVISGAAALLAQAGAYPMHLFVAWDTKFVSQLELTYRLTGWGLSVIPIAAVSGFVIGLAVTAVYLRAKSPAAFVNRD